MFPENIYIEGEDVFRNVVGRISEKEGGEVRFLIITYEPTQHSENTFVNFTSQLVLNLLNLMQLNHLSAKIKLNIYVFFTFNSS